MEYEIYQDHTLKTTRDILNDEAFVSGNNSTSLSWKWSIFSNHNLSQTGNLITFNHLIVFLYFLFFFFFFFLRRREERENFLNKKKTHRFPSREREREEKKKKGKKEVDLFQIVLIRHVNGSNLWKSSIDRSVRL